MELTRRGLLRAAAGAATAAAAASLPACAARPAPIGGRFVDDLGDRGHLLRDGAPGGPVALRDGTRVAILGGGVAGLSAAWKLARAGVRDFVVLEVGGDLGGTAAAGASAVSAHPWGAHYVPVPTREQRTLAELLLEIGVLHGFDAHGRGIADEAHLCRAPQERLFHHGAWSEGLYPFDGATPDDLRQLERFRAETARLAAWRDAEGRRAFAIPVATGSRCEDVLALDRVTMDRWMTERAYTSRRLRWWVGYACRDDFGVRLADVSAWAALHYFCARRADGEDEPAEFLTWPEGNAFLVRHLARAAEGRVRTAATVLRVEQDATGATVRWHDGTEGVLRETRAEHVVCALPRFAARRVVAGLEGETGGFTYAPWVVANLTLRSRPRERGFPLCWDNVLCDSDALGYVVATHQTDRLGADSVWTWYRPFCGPDPAADRAAIRAAPWETWRDAVLADLVRAHPDLDDHVVSVDVRRWGHAMVRPVPGFVWGEARRRAAEPLGRVRFAGADVGGLPLFEEAQWTGVRAAEDVLAALGVACASSL